MAKQTMTWVCTETSESKKRKIPLWMRSAAMTDDGIVYVPADFAGHENMVLPCALHDGTSAIFDSDHLYVPSGWLAKEFPHTAELCKSIERAMRRHLNRDLPERQP